MMSIPVLPPPPPSLPPCSSSAPPPLINNSDSPFFDSFDDMTPFDADEYQSFHGGFPALPSAEATNFAPIYIPPESATDYSPSIMDKEPPTEEVSPNFSSRLPATGSSTPSSDHTLDLSACEDALFKHRRRALLCESKRRALMNSLFLSLRSTIPDLASVTDRCNVIDRTCDYMKGLERELVFLRKKSRVVSSLSGESMEYSGYVGQVSPSSGAGDDDAAFIRKKKDYCKGLHPCVHVIYCGTSFSLNIEIGCWEYNRSGLFPSLIHILESNDLEVLSANRSQRMQAVLYVLLVKTSRPLQRRDIKTLRSQLYAQVCKVMAASDT